MPSSLRPQSRFDPIPPNLDLPKLVEDTTNFKWAQRVSRSQMQQLDQRQFEELVARHVVAAGKPLVIEGWQDALPEELFSVGWLAATYGTKHENVRDISNAVDVPMTTGHYLRSMPQLTNQWSSTNFRDARRQRLYLKDIDCPKEWHEWLEKSINPNLFYLNENVTVHGSPAETDEYEASAASAGDLMSSLPDTMRAQNLMCYIGHEGTYTPAHREMCASLGHNIMVEASGDADGEKPGSSIWFMTERNDRQIVREYFLSALGHDIDIEKHFAQIDSWKQAPFDVNIVEQKPGDFIIIPPLAAHQVWNRGTRTIKVAWNRTTPETLQMALDEALPKARLVCRDEQYKNKALVYYSLQRYEERLVSMQIGNQQSLNGFINLETDMMRNSSHAIQLIADFRKLFELFSRVLVDEMFHYREKDVEMLTFNSCITCSYCRANIFNRFLTCKQCVRPLATGDEDAYDVCMECYAMGRSCACLSGLTWCEQWDWEELVEKHEIWRAIVIVNDSFIDLEKSPVPIEIAQQRSGNKSLAHICQDELKRRPWTDIKKQNTTIVEAESESESHHTLSNPAKHIKGSNVRKCHVCCHKDYTYRVQVCANMNCDEAYCYGVLYRAFDMMPQDVLQESNWQCPKCRGICNCGACRRAGKSNAYHPKNITPGHNTQQIADDRSVEALVDFKINNLSWLTALGDDGLSGHHRRLAKKTSAEPSSLAEADEDGLNAMESLLKFNDISKLKQQLSSHNTEAMDGNSGPLVYLSSSAVSILDQHQPIMGYDANDAPAVLNDYQQTTATATAYEELDASNLVEEESCSQRKSLNEIDNGVSPATEHTAAVADEEPDIQMTVDPALFEEYLNDEVEEGLNCTNERNQGEHSSIVPPQDYNPEKVVDDVRDETDDRHLETPLVSEGQRADALDKSTLQKLPGLKRRPEEHQFMSLAERMALLGKRFKIGRRKAENSPSHIPSPGTKEAGHENGVPETTTNPGISPRLVISLGGRRGGNKVVPQTPLAPGVSPRLVISLGGKRDENKVVPQPPLAPAVSPRLVINMGGKKQETSATDEVVSSSSDESDIPAKLPDPSRRFRGQRGGRRAANTADRPQEMSFKCPISTGRIARGIARGQPRGRPRGRPRGI